jgi:uncharacterized phiE125 gp8 family phage protein
MSMYLLSAPVIEPVALSEAKIAARVDGVEWDEIVSAGIVAARQVAEQETGLRFIAQTWRIELADWPVAADVFPVYRPSAVAVSYWNGAAWVTLTNAAQVAWGIVQGGFSVVPPLAGSFPALGDIAIGPRVRLDVTSGAADAATVPECVKTFIKALVTVLVHDPALNAKDAAHPLLRSLLDPVRTYA